MSKIRTKVGDALKDAETRKACWAIANIEAALKTLGTLSVPVLDAVRSYVEDQEQGKTGAAADFMRAFEIYLEEPMKAARARDRQEPFGMYREV
jgi:hypothetical protein